VNPPPQETFVAPGEKCPRININLADPLFTTNLAHISPLKQPPGFVDKSKEDKSIEYVLNPHAPHAFCSQQLLKS
jgi:hypothetical protein